MRHFPPPPHLIIIIIILFSYLRRGCYQRWIELTGLRIVYDLSQPPNQRVVEMMARCSQCRIPTYSHVRRNETYEVATTSFIAGGGDGNTAIKNNLVEHQISGTLNPLLIQQHSMLKSPFLPANVLLLFHSILSILFVWFDRFQASWTRMLSLILWLKFSRSPSEQSTASGSYQKPAALRAAAGELK